jgi:hypothetical protein
MTRDPNFTSNSPQVDIDAIFTQLRARQAFSRSQQGTVTADCRRRIVTAQRDLNKLNNQLREIKQDLHLDSAQSVVGCGLPTNNEVT